uniref:Uncharacterized protein n=1 Tax=Timema poppense TaxID=170557 RepID=A0A7R9DW97_TIMPO|nr:unnamed protein product [Timema poppensis]
MPGVAHCTVKYARYSSLDSVAH